jgi:hypothetical protein
LRKAEVIFGVAAILLAALFFVLSGSFPDSRSREVGMAFYPRVVSTIIFLLSLTVIYEAIKKKRPEPADQKPLFAMKDGGFFRALIMIGMTLVYLLVLSYLGFLIITPIFLIILMMVYKASSMWKIVLISGVTTLVVYVTFQLFLKIPLPTGIFYN